MGQVFYPYEPDQTLLLPPSLRDWVPEGHLAHFVSDTVDELDLTRCTLGTSSGGRTGQLAYEPRLLLKLLIYAYAVGLFSSRKIAKASRSWCRCVSGGGTAAEPPDAGAVSAGAQRAVSGLFVQVVRIARRGLVRWDAGHRWVETEGQRE